MAKTTVSSADLHEIELDERIDLAINEEDFNGMIDKADSFTNDQIETSKDWADKQTNIQNQQHDLTVKQINEQKAQAKKDYLKEQSGAYVDWQKQSDEYGANAEKMASTGLTNSGYSESSQVSMYNTYQNRVATARESYNRAVLNYDNAMTEARIQNSSALAEIAYEALKDQLQLSLEGFQYKNTLILQKAATAREIKSMYHSKYMDVLQQINTENALAEEKRQFDEQMAWEKSKYNASSGGGGSSGGGTITKKTGSGNGNNSSNIDKGQNSGNAGVQHAYEMLVNGGYINYSSVSQFIKQHKLSNGGVPLLDQESWVIAKRNGELGSDLENFTDYKDYLTGYLAWCISQ